MLNNIINIKEDEFLELRDIIYKNSSITFIDTKKYLIENRLSKRLAELNFNSYKDYIYYLKYDRNARQEMDTMINLITINETYFLRERAQMDHMISSSIPQMLADGKRSLRIWSAACSTGEEPYSLAILLTEAKAYEKFSKIEIMATDINSNVVEIAKAAEYRSMSFRGTPADFAVKYFEQDKMIYKLKPEIKAKVRFNVGNLTAPGIGAQMGKFDVIFCRNVLIYFDSDGKTKVVNMFHNCLNNPGYLYLGHSENISKLTDKFKVVNFGSGLMHTKA